MKNILTGRDYASKPFAKKVKKILKSETEIAERNKLHSFCNYSETLGDGKKFFLTGKMQETMEKLRKKT